MEREKIEYKKGMGLREQVNIDANKVYYDIVTERLLEEFAKALDKKSDETILPQAITGKQGFIEFELLMRRQFGASDEELEEYRKELNDTLDNRLYKIG